MTVHKFFIVSGYDIDEDSVHAEQVEDGIQLMKGNRYGSGTIEGFAYVFNADKFSFAEAATWLEGKSISYVRTVMTAPEPERAQFSVNANTSKASHDDPENPFPRQIELEVTKVGSWPAGMIDENGNEVEGDVEITAEMILEAIQNGHPDGLPAIPLWLEHKDDQSAAREMFLKHDVYAMGGVFDAELKGDTLVAKANVPQSVADALSIGLIAERSIGLVKKAGKWFFEHVAFLKNSPPAVSGMKPAEITALMANATPTKPQFGQPRIVFATEAERDPGSPDTGGENPKDSGTTPEPQNPTSKDGKEQKMDPEVLAALRSAKKDVIASLEGVRINAEQAKLACEEIDKTEDVKVMDFIVANAKAAPELQKQPTKGTTRTDVPNTDDAPKSRVDKRADAILAASKREVERANTADKKELVHPVTTDGEARLNARAEILIAESGGKMDYGTAILAAAQMDQEDVDSYLEAHGRGKQAG